MDDEGLEALQGERRGLGCPGVAQGVGLEATSLLWGDESQRSWVCHLGVTAVMLGSLMALAEKVLMPASVFKALFEGKGWILLFFLLWSPFNLILVL